MCNIQSFHIGRNGDNVAVMNRIPVEVIISDAVLGYIMYSFAGNHLFGILYLCHEFRMPF